MPYLVFYRRGQELMRVLLDRPRTTVGRSSGADVVVPDPLVASTQAAIVREGETYRLVDLSGAKTSVDGTRVSDADIRDGTNITFGSFQALFQKELPEGASDPSQAQTQVTGLEAPSLPKDLWLVAQQVGGGFAPSNVALGAAVEIGSSASAGLRLENPTISAHHARLTRQEERLVLQDLGSTNGTWLNGVRVHEVEISPGVRFRIGPWDIWVDGKKAAPSASEDFEGLISADPGMRAIFAQVDRVAQSNAPVVITGESGTGKELLAEAIHRRSLRAGASLVPINCGAIAHSLMEAEIFGHEKGSYTGADTVRKGALLEADGGTLFLDEIGELPLDLQPKLLRAVELGEIKPIGAGKPSKVNVRFVCATNRNLGDEIRYRRFREDLFFRLAVVTLQLPPLRHRLGDVPLLWAYFMRKLGTTTVPLALSEAARAKLLEHRWPGNVRELRNVAQRALLTCLSTVIEPEHIVFDAHTLEPGAGASETINPVGQTLAQIEAAAIEINLRHFKGNRRAVTKQLDIAKSTLLKKIADYQLERVGLPAGSVDDED
jgi:DNA-binding NtrC family response regulator/pSer/pThr/pTyr-binding forkhead associated (FHA) protein